MTGTILIAETVAYALRAEGYAAEHVTPGGAVLLSLILAAIMVLTRKVEWYRAAAAVPSASRGDG